MLVVRPSASDMEFSFICASEVGCSTGQDDSRLLELLTQPSERVSFPWGRRAQTSSANNQADISRPETQNIIGALAEPLQPASREVYNESLEKAQVCVDEVETRVINELSVPCTKPKVTEASSQLNARAEAFVPKTYPTVVSQDPAPPPPPAQLPIQSAPPPPPPAVVPTPGLMQRRSSNTYQHHGPYQHTPLVSSSMTHPPPPLIHNHPTPGIPVNGPSDALRLGMMGSTAAPSQIHYPMQAPPNRAMMPPPMPGMTAAGYFPSNNPAINATPDVHSIGMHSAYQRTPVYPAPIRQELQHGLYHAYDPYIRHAPPNVHSNPSRHHHHSGGPHNPPLNAYHPATLYRGGHSGGVGLPYPEHTTNVNHTDNFHPRQILQRPSAEGKPIALPGPPLTRDAPPPQPTMSHPPPAVTHSPPTMSHPPPAMSHPPSVVTHPRRPSSDHGLSGEVTEGPVIQGLTTFGGIHFGFSGNETLILKEKSDSVEMPQQSSNAGRKVNSAGVNFGPISKAASSQHAILSSNKGRNEPTSPAAVRAVEKKNDIFKKTEHPVPSLVSPILPAADSKLAEESTATNTNQAYGSSAATQGAPNAGPDTQQAASPTTDTASLSKAVASPAPARLHVTSSPPAPQPSSNSPAPTSWANLFANRTSTSGAKPAQVVSTESKTEVVPEVNGKPANEMGALFSNYQLNQAVVFIQARRLINQANWCYVNSTLQALLACPPFYRLLKSLPAFPSLSREKTVTPVLESMVEFVNEFTELGEKARRRRDLKQGTPFEPSYVYNVLINMKLSENTFQRGKQEDAEEFLTCLLNKLHEEMGAAIKQNRKPEALMNGHDHNGANIQGDNGELEDDDEGEWSQVGPRNKSVLTTSNVDKMSTPISKIFGGLLRSSLSTGGKTKDSAVLEPFFTVPLNVQPTSSTIEEALSEFVSKETIDGYTCPKTKQELAAHRRLTFELLPPILIIHLKCFVYDVHGGSQKVLHNMRFKETLDFDKELLSSPKKSLALEQRSYKLFAVVYHSGQKTTGGHYHTDVFHSGVQSWVRFDDNSTKIVDTSDVLDFRHPCVPYLLYYKRADMLHTHSSHTNTGATNNSV